ncbi:MAG: hypothetical protein ACKOXK_05100 [Chakrabartia sp.]
MSRPDPASDRRESWRRIRVGLTGLGGILLLIGLANAMLQQLGQTSAPVAPNVSGVTPRNGDTKNEPLAELGVAPGAPAPNPPRDAAPKK